MWWSFVLAGLTVIAMWVTGNHSRWGWMIGLFNQILWTTYALVTHQYGFFIAIIALSYVYIRNFLKWSKQVQFSRHYSIEGERSA